MTPRSLDPDSITQKLALMRDALDLLRRTDMPTAAALREDGLLRAAVERLLMQLVDQAVAINLHVSGALGGTTERDYRASFGAAAEVGVLPAELAEELADSAGMRNVLVHEYVRVDLEQVAAALPRAVEGYERYVDAVADFLLTR